MRLNPCVLFLPLALASLSLGSVPAADARTISVTGTLSSRTNYGDQISLSLPAGLRRLTVRIPLPAQVESFGVTQVPGTIRVTASRLPAEEQTETDGQGNVSRVLVFTHPAPGPLVIQVHAPQLRITADLDRPLPVVALPLANVPADATPYLQPSKMVQSNAEPLVLLARDVQLGTHDEAGVADKITTWLARNLTYGLEAPGGMKEDALSVLTHRRAQCEGWAHLFLALARASGIPARFVAGYSLAGNVTYPASGDGGQTLTISGLSLPHAWVEVWFPGAGWVPYDPQTSSGFVDSHHVRCSVSLDSFSQVPLLSWVAAPGSDYPYYQESSIGTDPDDTNTIRFSYARSEPRGGEMISRAAATPPDTAIDVADAPSHFSVW